MRWTTEKAEDAFLKIYHGGELRGPEDWLLEIKQKCGWSTYFPVTFLFLTGLRTGEGVLCLNKIAESGLDGYLNREQGVLEHFRDKRFIRRTKKSFISVMSSRMVEYLGTWKEKTSYTAMRKRLERRGIAVRFYDARKWFNTTLRTGGVDSEICDLLCGRLPRDGFFRSYFRPELSGYFEKVLKILEPYEKLWLD